MTVLMNLNANNEHGAASKYCVYAELRAEAARRTDEHPSVERGGGG